MTQPELPLTGRLALVTGASRGIGRAVAIALADAGADVAVNYRSNKSEAAETLDAILRLGRRTGAYAADVSRFDEVVAMREEIHRDLGRVSILVNNAGLNLDKSFRNLDLESWERVVDTSLTGAFNVTKVFHTDLVAAGPVGRVVSVSSIVGEMGNFGQVNYAAAKAGLIGFTKALAREMAKHEVTVNAVAPGFVETEMLAAVPAPARAKLLERIPLGRFGSPRDVADVVTFLASPQASWITGGTIPVNGGMSLL